MSWSIDSTHPDVFFTTRASVVLANGVEITDASGWMHVDMPLRAVFIGAPCIVSVRLHLELDGQGRPRAECREILADGAVYARVTDLIAAFPTWAHDIGQAVDLQINRCVFERLLSGTDVADATSEPALVQRVRAVPARRFTTAARSAWEN